MNHSRLSLLRRRRAFPETLLLTIGVLAIPTVWVLIGATGIVDETFIPGLDDVAGTAIDLVAEGELQRHLFISFGRVVVGVAVGTSLGLILGLLIGRIRLIADLTEPLVDVVRQISPVAWIPLAILWFGLGEGSKVFIVGLGAFFPVVVNIASGVRNVDPRIVQAAASLGAHGYQVFVRVVLPACLPSLFTGMTIGLGNSVRFVVAAELTGATSGIGFMMMEARETLRTDVVFVGIVSLALMGSLAMWLLQIGQARALRWRSRDAFT